MNPYTRKLVTTFYLLPILLTRQLFLCFAGGLETGPWLARIGGFVILAINAGEEALFILFDVAYVSL